jgi:hypothetical protein
MKQKKMGRPLKGAGRSRTRTFRLTEVLDGQLQAAAARANRTVSDEIEYRLTQSFRVQQMSEVLAQEIIATATAQPPTAGLIVKKGRKS